MHFKINFVHLLLPAATGLVIPRALNFGTVVFDLASVDQATKALLTKVNGFDQSQTLLGAIPILTYRDNLKAAIAKSTSDATDNPTEYQFSPMEAQTLGDLITGGLTPHIYSLLQAMEAKKPDFDAVGATGIVIDSIVTLFKMTDDLANAWLALTPDQGDLIPKGQAAKATIDGYYRDCYIFYSPIIG